MSERTPRHHEAGWKDEDELVRWLGRLFGKSASGFAVGIGDDAAVLRLGSTRLVWTTDVLVEGRDFLADSSPENLGHKLLAVNLSDLAAMGASPWAALATLTMPPQTPRGWAAGVARGLACAAKAHRVAIVGGDISSGGERSAGLSLLGKMAPRSAPLLRAGGRPGDQLWVSGTLGRAALGLAFVQRGLRRRDNGTLAPSPLAGRLPAAQAREAAGAIAALDLPVPRLSLGRTLVRRHLASAAIDLSDGLARDLPRLARASRCGARVDGGKLPAVGLSLGLASLLRFRDDEVSRHRLRLALFGGEDFQLLLAAPPSSAAALEKLGCTAIGKLTTNPRLGLIDLEGRVRPWPRGGFDHFTGDFANGDSESGS